MSKEEQQGFTLIADVALIHDQKVLLVKYKDPEAYDGQSDWFLPDASIRYLEHPEKAAVRLLKEQLGLQPLPIGLDHMESFRGNDGSWHLAFHYKATLAQDPLLKTSEVIAAKQWFGLGQLPPKDEVAHHGWANTILKKMTR